MTSTGTTVPSPEPCPLLQAVTPAEAAAALGATERWVRDQIRARRVPCLRPGRRVALLPEHVAALAELATVPAQTPAPAPVAPVALAALGATPRSAAARRKPR